MGHLAFDKPRISTTPVSIHETMTVYATLNQHQPVDDEPGELYNPYELAKNRPTSIDLALELEHQLGSESVPSTPAYPHGCSARPQSLDPHILASIVVQLQHSLSEMSKERDELQHMLSVATSQAADVKDTLQYMEEKCVKLEEELQGAKKQMADDETAVALLRSKVEESRRGLMRLQAETKQSRRQSQMSMSVDLSRGGIPSFGSSSSNKRASFTPLTGTSYQRPLAFTSSSVSVADPTLPVDGLPMSPPSHIVSLSDSNGMFPTGNPTPGSLRFSGILGRTSPEPNAQMLSGSTAEADALRRELKALKDELEDTRHELVESNEAREASEICMKALRDFIEENDVGGDLSTAKQNPPGPSKLPPTPHMATREEADTSARNRNGSISGWGLKLWAGGGSSTRASSSGSNISSQAIAIPPPPSAAFSKFSGFFSSKPYSSSTTTFSTQVSQREPVYNGSDTSSIIESVPEPISPTGEMTRTSVLVRGHNLTGSQSSSSVDGLRSDINQVKSSDGDGHQSIGGLTGCLA